MLKRVYIENAAALVVTLDNENKADRIVELARRQRPDLIIHARARHSSHAARLLALGTNEVVPETLEASLQIAGRLLQALGTSEEVALARIAVQRGLELAELSSSKDG